MNAKRNISLFFHWESLLLLPIFYILSFVIQFGFDYSLNEKDLIPYSGKVVIVKTVDATDQKSRLKYGKGHSVAMMIDTQPELIFTTATQSGSSFEQFILSRITLGDSITIFTKPTLFTSSIYRITKLTKNQLEIIPFYSNKKPILTFLIILLLFFTGLTFIYVLLLKRRFLKLSQ